VKLASRIRDFVIAGMIWSVACVAVDFLGLTAGSPSPWGGRCRGRGDMAVLRKLIGNFPKR
jgi:hypothetical protein